MLNGPRGTVGHSMNIIVRNAKKRLKRSLGIQLREFLVLPAENGPTERFPYFQQRELRAVAARVPPGLAEKLDLSALRSSQRPNDPVYRSGPKPPVFLGELY